MSMTPTGWWQNSKGQMQPPGSFLDPSLRVKSESSTETAGLSPIKWVRRAMATARRPHHVIHG
jgi:hypothetical protein